MFAGCDNIRKAGHMHICTEKIIGKYSTVSSIVCFSGGKRPGVFFALKSFLSSYFSDNSWAMGRNFIQRLLLGYVAAFLRSMYKSIIYYSSN